MANQWANLATESDDANFACAWAGGDSQQQPSSSSGWASLAVVDEVSGGASAGWASLGGNVDVDDGEDYHEILPAVSANPVVPTKNDILATIANIDEDTTIAELRVALRDCTALVESAENIQQIGECGPS